MKQFSLILFSLLVCSSSVRGGDAMPGDLLRTLNAAIDSSEVYTGYKKARIEELRLRKTGARSTEDIYRINSEIIDNYESFLCDSAEYYVLQNIRIARSLGNPDHLSESRLRLAFLYSLSGLFLQANDIFRSIDYGRLPADQKCRYYWNSIRYYENLIKYTNDSQLSDEYKGEIGRCRDSLLSLLPVGSTDWQTERAFQLMEQGQPDRALEIFEGIFRSRDPQTHPYAMGAMCLAKAYGQAGDSAMEERYLILAATMDIRLAVKENEALLALATRLFEKGDIDRAYSYISYALNDANFYNSRFKNTVIARLYPIIESSYLYKLDKQRHNLRFYATMSSLLVLALAIALFFYFRQTKVISRARRELAALTQELISLNRNLDEANLVKERYLGYFMNQCAIYINKLDKYRRDINLKIRNKQFDRLHDLSLQAPGREEEELCRNFDRAFLNLYPNFVEKFNALLNPQSRYTPEEGRLNTELRIFALIRLGVSDVNQIADFLRCSPQTIYNYKSKIKKAALNGGDNFEETVRKLGSLSLDAFPSCLPADNA
jgi:hypothetical protein